jgi:hypothetical protein
MPRDQADVPVEAFEQLVYRCGCVTTLDHRLLAECEVSATVDAQRRAKHRYAAWAAFNLIRCSQHRHVGWRKRS